MVLMRCCIFIYKTVKRPIDSDSQQVEMARTDAVETFKRGDGWSDVVISIERACKNTARTTVSQKMIDEEKQWTGEAILARF